MTGGCPFYCDLPVIQIRKAWGMSGRSRGCPQEPGPSLPCFQLISPPESLGVVSEVVLCRLWGFRGPELCSWGLEL